MAAFFQWQGGDLVLRCHVQPGASENAFCGLHGERLKLRIKAPAEAGKANEALLAFLATRFAVSKSDIRITAGAQSRQKTLKIAAPRQLPEELELA